MLTTARITDEDLASVARELAARLNRLALLLDDPRQQQRQPPTDSDTDRRRQTR